MSSAELYQSHLDRVSRSFALCIQQLPEPLHSWVGLSYLLCRIVDTIEDSAWPSPEAQFAAFQTFDDCLLNAQKAQKTESWVHSFPADLPPGERLLIGDTTRLLRDYHALPKPVHETIYKLVLSMSQGMQHFCRNRKAGQLRLGTLAEVNQYCFFVAGVVGELLANLVARVEPRFSLSQVSLLRAHHFGLFLQKVNLLKDQVTDEQVGRHLIPSRELVEDSSQVNALGALDFLIDVPKEQLEFRRFCAWSLFLGLEALSVARDSLRSQRVLKVSRADMSDIFMQVEGALSDDVALRALFASFAQKLGWPKKGIVSLKVLDFPDWLLKLYRGPLDARSISELGVASGS